MEFIHFGDTELESCSRMSIDPEVIDFVSPCKFIWGSGDIISFVIYCTYIQGKFNQSTNYPDWMWSSLLGWTATSLICNSCPPQKTSSLVSFMCSLPPPRHMRSCDHTHTHLHKMHMHVQS